MITVTLTAQESNVLASANYAYGSTFATPEQRKLFNSFGEKMNEAIHALPHGAQEVTVQVTHEEEGVLLLSVAKMIETSDMLESVLGQAAQPIFDALSSLCEKFTQAHDQEESHEEPGEGGHPAGSDGLASTGEPAVPDQLSISWS